MLHCQKHAGPNSAREEITDIDMKLVNEEIRNIRFLHSLPKPQHFPLKWTSPDEDLPDQSRDRVYPDKDPTDPWCDRVRSPLLCANELFPRDSAHLVSATAAIIDDFRMPYSVKELLGVKGRVASLEQVMQVIHSVFPK